MKLARPLPELETLIMIEMIISLGIIAIAIASFAVNYETLKKKAQLTQLFSFFADTKSDKMIKMALTGEGYFSDSSAQKPDGKLMPTMDRFQMDGVQIQEKAVGNTIRYEGKLGNPFYLTYAPSVIAEGPIGTVLWLCGNNKPPTGWTQPAHTGTDLPPEAIPFDCRNP